MLILVSEGERRRCIEVDLEKGCYPRVSSHLLSSKDIESSFWFKVLILDSISIDCRNKEVSWTYLWKRENGNVEGASDQTLTRRMGLFDMGRVECYDFDDEAEEMFDTARQLAKETSPLDSGSLGEDDFEVLLQLLNSYLLAMVTFEVPSLPYVQAAYATMQKDVAWIDHRVETVSDCYGEAKGELSKQIRQLLPRLEDDLKQKANIGRNLLETIRDDLKREEKRAQELFRDKGLAVEKKRSENPSKGDAEMQRLRDERQAAHSDVIQILTCRELIHDAMTKRETRSLSKSMSPGGNERQRRGRSRSDLGDVYTKYLEARQRVQATYKQQESIFDAKILAAEFRESLRETMEQLKDGVACQGASTKKHGGDTEQFDGGERAKKYCKWQVVKNKVDIVLTDLANPLLQQHQTFCMRMSERLQTIVKMLKDNQGVFCHQCNAVTITVGGGSAGAAEDDDGYEEAYDDCSFGLDCLTDMIKPCIADIMKHSESMSWDLAKTLGSQQYMNQYWQRKIQIRYDRRLYEDIGPYVEAVYQAYYVHNRALERHVSYLSNKDVQDMNLGLRPESWHCVFDRDHARQTPTRSPPLLYRRDSANAAAATATVAVETWPTGSDEELPLTFDNYFGMVRECLEEVLCQNTPLTKLQSLTAALRKVMSSMSTLKARAKDGKGGAEAIGADDLLPTLVAVLTRLNSSLLVAIKRQCHMLSDLIPDFLSTGCYGYALAQFSAALQVLENGLDVAAKNG